LTSRSYNLNHEFNKITNLYGEKHVICLDGLCHSFKEMDLTSSQIINYFFSIGLKHGDVIALSADKNIITYAMILACIKSGIAYSFFDSSLPLLRLDKQFLMLNPKFIVTQNNKIVDYFHSRYNLSSVDEISNKVRQYTSEVVRNLDIVSSSTIAYIMFTSGSTGSPKGVAISHGNIINFIDWIRKNLGVCDSDKVTGLNKLFFDNSIFDFYATFFTGACLYPINEKLLGDSTELFDFIDKNSINIWFSVPSLIIYHLTISPHKCNSFRNFKKIIFGGEGFPKNNLFKLWNKVDGISKLINVYGPTECTCICSSYEITINDFKKDSMEKLAPIGDICPNVDYVIVNNGVECSKGEVGELYIGGVSVGSGYWNNHDLSIEKFVQNPLHNNYMDIYYKSGDLVRLNKNNLLEFVSRSDYQIKHMGYRIELSEIENNLHSNKVYESCAIYFKNGEYGFIKLFYSGIMTEDQVLSYLIERLPSYMVPRVIVKLDILPKNSNGKINRRALQDF
jgi:D-alanine--poly(phosphoribitol) ligase subunit 1